MTIANVDNTTLNNLTPNLDIGDVADPALRLAAFQYIYTEMQAIITELNSIPTANLQNLSVTAAKLAALSVETGKIAELAVTTAKIAEASVTLSKMAANSVGTTQLIDLAVTRAKIALQAVGSAQLDPTLLTDFGDIAVQAEFDRRGINVMKFGAVGNGSDNTIAIQNAINYASTQNNKKVLIPSGVYGISHLELLTNVYSGIELIGIGEVVFSQILPAERHMQGEYGLPTYARTQWADGMLVIDGNSIVDGANIKDYAVKDVIVENIQFLSDVVTKGFDELLHHICAGGVMNLTIKNCKFTGFLGDGVCVVPGRDVGVSRYEQNQNVNVLDCQFDGVNKDNRQAVSIYNCDGFRIEDNTMINTTRSDMPGAIDIEPSDNTSITRGGSIKRNKIDNCGGNVGAIGVVVRNSDTNQQASFVISENIITNCVNAFGVFTLLTRINHSYKHVIIEKNYVKDSGAFRISGSSLVSVIDNYFENVTFPASSVTNSIYVEIRKNTFNIVTTPDGLTIDSLSENVCINDNIFREITGIAISSNGNGVISLQRNIFKEALLPVQAAFTTTFKNYIVASTMTIKDNIVDATFAPIDLAIYINAGNPQSESSTPDKFLLGETTIFVYVTIDGVPKMGCLVTKRQESTPESYPLTLQVFWPNDPALPILSRSAETATTWTSWYRTTRTLPT